MELSRPQSAGPSSPGLQNEQTEPSGKAAFAKHTSGTCNNYVQTVSRVEGKHSSAALVLVQRVGPSNRSRLASFT